jgi:predicted nucleotidyltransferase
MNQAINIQDDLIEARRIILHFFRDYQVKIYLFGSLAKGTSHQLSDIDIAILPEEPIPFGLISEIRLALEDSNILATVDLVDLTTASRALHDRVLKEGILWKD